MTGLRGRAWLRLALSVVTGFAGVHVAMAQALDYRLTARLVAPDVWVIEGANADFSPANGCNIINTGFIATDAGVYVINTGPSRLYGEQQRSLIARTTPKPVRAVLNLNLHPDYFFGNQAWRDVPILALPGTRAGMQAEAKAYADNLYRLCGDWMKGTEPLLPTADVQTGAARWGGHEVELRRLDGHTDDDLVLIDRSRSVVFAGGLVFAQRAPTTPHAKLPRWQASLAALRAELKPEVVVVPSHGPVHQGLRGADQTSSYLQWLDRTLQQSAERGLDISEVLRLPLPETYRDFAAIATEYPRNVTNLYPDYERRALGGGSAR